MRGPTTPFISWGSPPVTAELEQLCRVCWRKISRGVRIRKVDGLGWVHGRCARRHALRDDREGAPA